MRHVGAEAGDGDERKSKQRRAVARMLPSARRTAIDIYRAAEWRGGVAARARAS